MPKNLQRLHSITSQVSHTLITKKVPHFIAPATYSSARTLRKQRTQAKMKVLLTGGSGFIAAHCVDYLLQRGHDVVFTVRSDEKGETILKNHPKATKSQLSYVIVKDIAVEGAFDEAVKSDPPFEGVLHTASPFHFKVTDPKKDLLDPAIIGTTGILRAIKANAPTVKRVVITSSFAAIVSPNKHPEKYSEENWNPVTWEEALKDPSTAYRGSKTFAEKAAWEFVEKEKPNFNISTINPPLVFGPVVGYLNSLESINTSNERFVKLIQGDMQDGLAPSGMHLWVDVRDVALAHVLALESDEAAGKRFFCTQGYFSNADLAKAIKKNFPEYGNKLPVELKSDMPEGYFGYDNSRARTVLGIEFRPLEKCVVDTVNSLQDVGA